MPKFESIEMEKKVSAESRDLGFESNKENKESKEEKELAAKERLEQTVVEVKNTKQRMKNIMNNMQQVIQAVRQIRQQLGLDGNDDDIPAVQRDQKTFEQLKVRLAELKDQLEDLKKALRAEEINHLREIEPETNEDEINLRADVIVEKALQAMGLE